MSINVSMNPHSQTMVLRFDNRLDFSLSREICAVCDRITPGIKMCILDTRDVDRVFDSGVALLSMLVKKFRQLGTEIVFRGLHPDLQRHINYIMPL